MYSIVPEVTWDVYAPYDDDLSQMQIFVDGVDVHASTVVITEEEACVNDDADRSNDFVHVEGEVDIDKEAITAPLMDDVDAIHFNVPTRNAFDILADLADF